MPVIETERLPLRELTKADFEAAREILDGALVVYAWEHGFSDGEVRAWIAENIARYRRDGFGCLAAADRASGALAGFIGPLSRTWTASGEWASSIYQAGISGGAATQRRVRRHAQIMRSTDSTPARSSPRYARETAPRGA